MFDQTQGIAAAAHMESGFLALAGIQSQEFVHGTCSKCLPTFTQLDVQSTWTRWYINKGVKYLIFSHLD